MSSLQTPKDQNGKSLQPEHFFHVGVHHWNLSRSHSNSNLLDVFLAKNLPLYPETVCTSKLLTFCVGKTWTNHQSTPTVKTNWIKKKQMNQRLTSVSSRFTPSKTHFHLHIRTSSPRGLASLPSPVLAAVVPLTRQLPPWIRLHPTSEFPSWNGNPPDIDIPRSGSDFQRVASSNNDDSFAFWGNNWKVKVKFSEGGLLEEDAFVVMKCCCLELSEAF